MKRYNKDGTSKGLVKKVKNVCIINTEYKNREQDFLLFNIWGKPLIMYAIDNSISSGVFEEIYLKTKNSKIAKIIKDKYPNIKKYYRKIDNAKVIELSAFAPLIKKETIINVINLLDNYKYVYCTKKEIETKVKSGQLYSSIKDECLDVLYANNTSLMKKSVNLSISNNESLTVDNEVNFEASLSLIKKIINNELLEKKIDDLISKKKKILQKKSKKNEVLLIGHSQFDMWNIKKIGKYNIKNCGISGINTFQYVEKIINKGLLDCSDGIALLLFGTNDIVYDYSLNEIACEITKVIDYISLRNKSPIFLLECAHTNGRMDRSNKVIDELNKRIKRIKRNVHIVPLSEMDNEYGELRDDYTEDGLHFSKKGYKELEKIILREIH